MLIAMDITCSVSTEGHQQEPRLEALCIARIYKHANIHLAMLKRMKYVRVLGVAKWGGAIATQQYGRRTAARDLPIADFS